MGNTCASVHIAWRGTVDDAAKGISRSYSKLGYERAKKAPAEGGKHVVLFARAGQSFVSVYDSDNAQLDSGELKELARATSKALKTAAVFTSLYDSDTYEFVVFANGRQVDLLMSDAESYDGPLKRLRDQARAGKWSRLFRRTLTGDQFKQTVAKPSAFADDVIAGLSRLIGLDGGQPQRNYQDFLEDEQEITAQLYFKKKPKPPVDIPAGEIRLANGFDPDDTRMLLVYPASWPIPVGRRQNVKWMILSQGAGFRGGTATIRVSGPDGLVLSRGAMRGFKFHNGQIVGDLETRPTDKDHVKDYYGFDLTPIASESSGSRSYNALFPNLSIPPMTVGRTTQILILFLLYEIESPAAGQWEINVSIQPGAQVDYQHNLPSVRIAAVEQGWLPVVSGLNPKASYDQSNFSTDPRNEQNYLREVKDKQSRIVDDRRVIHPAITSSVAIVKDEGQATLDACTSWLLAWLRPLADQQDGELRVSIEKKLPKHVFKAKITKKSMPISVFHQDKAWRRLFDYTHQYQSILAAFVPAGSERAVAGIGLQYSHERNYFLDFSGPGRGYETQIAKTLSNMRGRPFAEEAYNSTLHAFNWVTNHAECYAYLSTSLSDMVQRLDRFAAENAPLQAWTSQCTWVPLFDRAARGELTLYEQASVFNWFRGVDTCGGLHRRMMSVQWCGNVLRMVTPDLWVCRNLIDQVDRAALERIAQVTEKGGVYRIALRSGHALDELELALVPILPIESARIKRL
jgi:hypothetical protein